MAATSPDAQLVQDLARLLLVHGVDRAAQPPRQHAQRLLGDRRVERQHLDRRDQAVAPEQGGEPRDAGGVVGLAVELGPEHVQVEDRALQQRG